MGTPNFASPKNASKYYVVLASYEVNASECQECNDKKYEHEEGYVCSEGEKCTVCGSAEIDFLVEHRNPESWECEDFISNIGQAIEDLGGAADNEHLGDRSYPVQSLGYLEETKYYGDSAVEVRLLAVIQSAYYDGATLDYYIQVNNSYEWCDVGLGRYDDNIKDVLKDAFESSDTMNEGMQTIQARFAERWVDDAINELSKKLEDLFQQYSEHKLQCDGVFSNGEAIYSAAS